MVKTRKQRGGQEKVYQIIMPLRFNKAEHDLEYIEKKKNENALEHRKKVQLFREMDERFPTAQAIENHIKEQDPTEFVEYLVNGDEFDAHWHPEKFEIRFKVKSKESLDEIRRTIESISLADGQWESSGDNGWTVKTEPYKTGVYGSATYEYGLTDFDPRQVQITVVQQKNNQNQKGGKKKTQKSKQIHRK